MRSLESGQDTIHGVLSDVDVGFGGVKTGKRL